MAPVFLRTLMTFSGRSSKRFSKRAVWVSRSTLLFEAKVFEFVGYAAIVFGELVAEVFDVVLDVVDAAFEFEVACAEEFVGRVGAGAFDIFGEFESLVDDHEDEGEAGEPGADLDWWCSGEVFWCHLVSGEACSARDGCADNAVETLQIEAHAVFVEEHADEVVDADEVLNGGDYGGFCNDEFDDGIDGFGVLRWFFRGSRFGCACRWRRGCGVGRSGGLGSRGRAGRCRGC
jgi:hypothetical protein